MKTTIKKLSATKVELKVTLSPAELERAKNQAIDRLSQDLRVPGFRKGKAPRKVAAQHLSANDINSTAADIAVRTTVPMAFTEAKLNPLVIPDVNITKYVPDETLEYVATAEILPEVKLGKFKKLKVKKLPTTVSPADIQEILDRIATSYAKKQTVKRPAALGDEVIIDFVGKKDGVAFDGGSAKDYALTLGSKHFIPGFEDGLVGKASGDKVELPLTFPKDYHNKNLAGAKVVFEVLVKQVNQVTKPKQDDAFAKKCGPFKSLTELKADIKKNLTAQNEARALEHYKDSLVNALVAGSKIPTPDILVSDQLNFIKEDITRNAASRGQKFEDYLAEAGQTVEEWEKEATKLATARVKASLALQVLAREQNITVEDQVVEAKIAELKDVYQKSPEALKNLQDPRVHADIRNRLTIEKTVDYLVSVNSPAKTS